MDRPLPHFIRQEHILTLTASAITAVRSGHRTLLDESKNGSTLAYHVGGQLPYFYRAPEKIAVDFSERRNALDMLYDMTVKMPTTPKFQQSHCGEVMAALFLEEVLNLRRLFCKLTLTTAENTNVHKMDGFFVDTSTQPFTFFAVEAKSSILPTEATPRKHHRHGILKDMVKSLNEYGPVDERFDFTTIRDNLESTFSAEDAKRIRMELVPPGPQCLVRLGIAVINESTIATEDDNYILTEPCQSAFHFRAITVSDLSSLAASAYAAALKLRGTQ